MSSGVPVVASTVGAFPDIVTAKFGRLSDPEDLDGLIVNLRELVSNPDLRARLGRAARALVETQHSITAEAEALIEVYRRLLTP
jgi:mannosyltransferase